MDAREALARILARSEMEAYVDLTQGEKEQYLRDIDTERLAGAIDDEIDAWLDLFNTLDGVVTTQSCAGHSDKDGYISLRVSQEMEPKLVSRLDEIVCSGHATVVYKVFEQVEMGLRPRWVFVFRETDREGVLTKLHSILASQRAVRSSEGSTGGGVVDAREVVEEYLHGEEAV